MAGSKSVKLFNLEDRKNSSGTAITEVDIFQWKNTLIDNLKRENDFADLCTEEARWGFEKEQNRGFSDIVQNDGSGARKAARVHSMLTKIASYAPKSIVREITRRTRSLADVWNIARDWAGIQSTGSKHLDYYKVKRSYLKEDKEETKQEFFYRLRDAMEDTLIRSSDKIKDDGEFVNVDEDMTPTVKSLVVLDWLDAIKGPVLVEHVHRVYAKELETCTLASLQTRLWKNMDSLLRECETEEESGKAYRAQAREDQDPAFFGQVGLQKRWGNGARGARQGAFRGRGLPRKNFNDYYSEKKDQRSSGRGALRSSEKPTGLEGCKLCKANGSPNFKSHEIADCWLLNEKERRKISSSYVRAQSLYATEEDECEEKDDYYQENEEDLDYD